MCGASAAGEEAGAVAVAAAAAALAAAAATSAMEGRRCTRSIAAVGLGTSTVNGDVDQSSLRVTERINAAAPSAKVWHEAAEVSSRWRRR